MSEDEKVETFPDELSKAIGEGLPRMEDNSLVKRAETIVRGYD